MGGGIFSSQLDGHTFSIMLAILVGFTLVTPSPLRRNAALALFRRCCFDGCIIMSFICATPAVVCGVRRRADDTPTTTLISAPRHKMTPF